MQAGSHVCSIATQLASHNARYSSAIHPQVIQHAAILDEQQCMHEVPPQLSQQSSPTVEAGSSIGCWLCAGMVIKVNNVRIVASPSNIKAGVRSFRIIASLLGYGSTICHADKSPVSKPSANIPLLLASRMCTSCPGLTCGVTHIPACSFVAQLTLYGPASTSISGA